MSVRENLELGAYLRRDRAEINEDLERVFDLFPRLQERDKQKAGTMSGGEQQMLAIGRAMMARPSCCCSTSPRWASRRSSSSGSTRRSPRSTSRGRRSSWSSRTRTSRSEYSSRGYVLETGTIALADKSAALRENPEVQKAYLGT